LGCAQSFLITATTDGATIHLAAPNARRKTMLKCAKHTNRRVVAVIKKQAAKLLQ
jgi:hypothetical protein